MKYTVKERNRKEVIGTFFKGITHIDGIRDTANVDCHGACLLTI